LSDTTTGPAEAAAKPRLTGAFWRLWTAGTISNLGDGVDLAALPLLAASLTRDPRLVAGMGVAFTLPWLLFALPAGAIVDRLDRRRTMYRVNMVRAALVACIALSVAMGAASIWILYAVALAMGFCETLFDNASQAMLPAIVHPSLLEVANGRQYAAEVVANTFVGPPLGGVLFAAAASAPFWLDSGSFLISALLIASLAGSFRPAPRPAGPGGTPAPRRSLRQDIAEGVHWLRRHRLLRTLALLLGAMNFASWLGMSTAVLFAQEILGLDDRGFGLLLAGMAVGGVIGGVFGPRIAAALGPGPALVMSIAAIGFSQAAVGLMSNAWAVAGLFWISGLFVPVWNIITVSLRQQIVPDHLLGRVNSVYRFLGWGLQPLGALAGGLIANAYGLRLPFLVGGAVTAVCLALAWPRITTHAIEAAKAAAPVRAPA
jgi:MFS family permease